MYFWFVVFYFLQEEEATRTSIIICDSVFSEDCDLGFIYCILEVCLCDYFWIFLDFH